MHTEKNNHEHFHRFVVCVQGDQLMAFELTAERLFKCFNKCQKMCKGFDFAVFSLSSIFSLCRIYC